MEELEDATMLDDAELVDELELDRGHIGVFQLAGFMHVASQGTGPQQADEPPLQPELVELLELDGLELLDEVTEGIEHSLVPPAILPPKVAALQVKLPVRFL